MNKSEFNALLDNNQYQVFLFYSNCNFPAPFATHPWLVLNEKGKISRYEGRFAINRDGKTIHIDAFEPLEGLGFINKRSRLRWPSKLQTYVEGGADSLAHRMISFIKDSVDTYPYLKKSKMMGPNSNTYVQWVLDQFPEFDGRLTWNALGKRYKKK